MRLFRLNRGGTIGWYMDDSTQQAPFQILGKRLKRIREDLRESLDDVSGAVEVDTDILERIELGAERPSEDLLMLLINHFGIQESEAVQLWESAGYGQPEPDERRFSSYDMQTKPTMVLLAIDARVLYSDNVMIAGSPQGLVLNFAQMTGQQKPMPVARVGMSYEQAEEVLHALQQTILHHKYAPKQPLLPPGQASAQTE